MRVYTRAEFMKLPAGTMYCKGVRWSFGALCVKDITTDYNDWYEMSLDWIDGRNSEECFDRLQVMLDSGASFPMQNSIYRDGMFDEENIFLV